MAKRQVSVRVLRGKDARAPEPPVRDGIGMMWQLALDKYGPAAHAPLRRDIVRVIRRKPRRRPRKR